jgi:hypothetical protein
VSTEPQRSLFPEEELGETGSVRWVQLYVGCSLTAVRDDTKAKSQLDSWCEAIDEAVASETGGDDLHTWTFKCYIPFAETAPWGEDGLRPEQIYERNSRALWTRCDAMIVVGLHGGSIGVGQELEWAIQQGIPILYLVPPDDHVSRQVEGAKSDADLTIRSFGGTRELKNAVRDWLATRREVIEDGQRVREIHRERVLVLQAAMEARWKMLDADGRAEVCATARLAPARVNRLLLDLDALAAAPLLQLTRLTAVLGVEIGIVRETAVLPSRLSPTQLVALEQAAEENGWGASTVARLAIEAGRILATPAIRRLNLEKMQHWVRFHDQRQDR